MTKALEKKDNGFPTAKIELIKRTIAKGTSDDELELFIYTAQRMGLDPMAKQIYAIPRWNKKEGRKVMTIQVAIDGYRLIADRTGLYCPGAETEFEHDSDGKLIAATAYVKKLVAGTWHQVSAKAMMSEYKGDSPLWHSMPYVMLEKCAESRALRRAFPAELSGVYTSEEMDQAAPTGPITIESRDVSAVTPTPTSKELHQTATAIDHNKIARAIVELQREYKPLLAIIAAKTGKGPRVVWWDLVADNMAWHCKKEKGELTATVYKRWADEDVKKMRSGLEVLAGEYQSPQPPDNTDPFTGDQLPPPPPDVPSEFGDDYADVGVQGELT